MSYVADPRVDAYIEALPDWQQTICQEVRALVHAADPEVEETIKRTVQPYFVLQGNVCALLAAKDHVNVFVYDGAIVPDPEGIITAGHGNQTARISLGAVDPAELRRAWLLTSQDSFARIDSWTEILQSRIGALTHEEAGRVTISDPTSQDKTKTIEVTVWRPKR